MISVTILIPFPVSISICPSISVVLFSSLVLFTCFFSLVFFFDEKVRSIIIYQPSRTTILNEIACNPSTSAHDFLLPDDSLSEVLCSLPLKDMVRCKSVSKSWNRIISDVCIPKVTCPLYGIFIPTGFTPNRKPCSTSAWKFSCINGTNSSSSSFLQSCFRLLPFTPLPEDIFDISNGFLLIWGRLVQRLYVVNPSTEQCILLPRSPEHRRPHSAALVFGPHFIVFYILHTPLRMFIYSSASCEWTMHRDGIYLEDSILAGRWSPRFVSLNGCIYLLSLSGHIVKFDIRQVSVRGIRLPEAALANPCGCTGVSKGRFHYASNAMAELFVWMLHENEWVLRHTISLLDLINYPTPGLFGDPLWLAVYAFHPNSDNLFLGHHKGIFCYHPDSKKFQCVYRVSDCAFISNGEIMVYPFSRNLAILDEPVKHQGRHRR